MKIDQTTGSAIPLPLGGKPRTAASPAPAAAPRTTDAPAGNVRAFPGPDDGSFDAARVAAIREEIRSGRYQVNPGRIADGILASARELIGKRQP